MSEFSLSMREVTKDYDGVRVLDVPELDVRQGEFFSLLGPSGSGKTTGLRLVAGFEAPTAGRIIINGQDVARVRAEKRNIGLVFQNYALFPHMTVAENVAFPLHMRSLSARDIERRVAEVLEQVDLAPFRDRNAATLSGGQQQRVAIARAIVYEPDLLLMDEPLGALDRRLRARLQGELRGLHHRLGIPIVYVTHDQDEAMALSDRVAIMNGGHIVQLGAPKELYDSPASLFVSNFLGDNNTLPARIAGPGRASLDGGATMPIKRTGAPAGTPADLTIRPERLRLVAEAEGAGQPDGPGFDGVIADVVALGAMTQYNVRIDGVGALWASVQNSAHAFSGVPGDRVGVRWELDDVHVFPREPGAPGGPSAADEATMATADA
ncbi:ABC transporter ATP-binding protein [Nonomuraea zeae]|uniref:ABC-type quaternary amine transporter n=1 Tax=Nonomuraea zeae TaxID=1642303 RepID=A0A5S4GSL6_9ACTN|nr:ABC transporter ATP-binding protein [Nonomuraea zeae]TMR35945.1 ABC transporter ATP-binding protein [Nonomuraea zeae]